MPYLVHHMLQDSASRDTDREALVCGDQRFSYGAVGERVAALAGGLRELGVRRGYRIVIYLPPSVELTLAIFAVSQASGVFVPIHHGSFPDQVAHIVRDSGANVLITDARRWIDLQKVKDQIATLDFVVSKDIVDGCDFRPVYEIEMLCCQASTTHCGETSIGKDLAAIIYTSGSTGSPKGVMLSHANVLAGAEIVSDYLGITKEDRLLAALPFSFDVGLNQLMTAALHGGTTVMIEFRFGADIVRMITDEAITGLAGVPSLWNLLAQPSSGLGKHPVTELRYITNTGGAMPQNTLAKLRALLPGTKVFLMYGLTEAFRSTYLSPQELDGRPDSIGKAIPNTEILVINEDGECCASGEVGELVHHGPTVSMGYWGCRDLTDRTLRPHPLPTDGCEVGDRVCYSGDLVRRDAEGFLYFVGRRDNQIKSAGFRISPTEIEEVIGNMPTILYAAVVGMPDPRLGQHLVAFAVLEEGAEMDSADILMKCAATLPRHMVPKRAELLNEMPLTANGKTDYARLREKSAAWDEELS